MAAEAVPGSAVLEGRPRGIFIGRSLLTGRAVCLLFLDDGRITRSIPSGGLAALDWARHQGDHIGDCGTWAMTGEQLTVTWGDGGVHEGRLTVNPEGIEFYGKRYARPTSIEPSDLVGAWEAAGGTAIVGGEGLVRLSTLSVEPDLRYRWDETIGGVVAGRATADAAASSGSLRLSEQTMTFDADDGSIVARTFLPVTGEQLEAFSLDASMFTRVT